MEKFTKEHVAGVLQHDKGFLIKLFGSGVLSALGLYELGVHLELSFVALIFIPAIGLVFTYLKLEADSNILRLISILVMAVIFGLLVKSFFLAAAFFLIVEGITHKESVIRYKDVKWLKGSESQESAGQLHKLLGNHILFRTLPKEMCESIDDHCLIIEVEAGSALIKEGEFNHYLYLLGRGNVDVIKHEKHLATLKAGDIFGEISAIGLTLPVADVVAVSDVLAFAIPIVIINEMARDCPEFSESLREIGMQHGGDW